MTQLATVLQLHPRTVKKLAAEGKIPKIVVGGSVRFSVADVEKALGCTLADVAKEAPAA